MFCAVGRSAPLDWFYRCEMFLIQPIKLKWTTYRRWARRAACRWCPWWWGRGPSGRWCPTSAAPPPETEASWSPRPAARPAWPPSEPPPPSACWGPAAGLKRKIWEDESRKIKCLWIQQLIQTCSFLWCLFIHKLFELIWNIDDSSAAHKYRNITTRCSGQIAQVGS